MAFRFLTIVAVLATVTVANAQIYTWKDANGHTHYSDQPPVGSSSHTLNSGRPAPSYASDNDEPKTNGSAPSAASSAPHKETWQEKDRDFKKRQKEKAEAQAKAQKEADANAAKEKRCTQLRNDLAALRAGGRFTQAGADGQRSYMTDQQISDRAARTSEEIDKECN